MELTFLCHNYYSLYLAFAYTRNIRRFIPHARISLIINDYLEVSQGCLHDTWDEVLIHEYIKFIGKSALGKIRALLRFYRGIRWKLLRKLKNNRSLMLFIFKDTGLVNREIIRYFHDRLNIRIAHIEDGLAIYWDAPGGGSRLKSIVKSMANIFGGTIQALLFLPGPYGRAQGMNSRIDAILARKIHLVPEKKRSGKLLIAQSRNLFNVEDAVAYLQEMHGITDAEVKRDLSETQVLYIGQPISDQGMYDKETEEEILWAVFRRLSRFRVTIKRHHLERQDKYEVLLNGCKNVKILDDRLNRVPVEALYAVSRVPVIITPWSAASISIQMMNPDVLAIYLYRLFHYALPGPAAQFISCFNGGGQIAIGDVAEIDTALFHIANSDEKAGRPDVGLFSDIREILDKSFGSGRPPKENGI